MRETYDYTMKCDWCDEPVTRSFPLPSAPAYNEYACCEHAAKYGPASADYKTIMADTMASKYAVQS